MKLKTKLKTAIHICIVSSLLSGNLQAQDGSLDLNFGVGGKVITDIRGYHDGATAIALQPDGKVLVAGTASDGTYPEFALVRYNSDGSLDIPFGVNGKVTTSIYSGDFYTSANEISLQPDGKILVGGIATSPTGPNFILVRYNSNGTLDLTFDTDGIVRTDIKVYDYLQAMILQSDGKILAAGSASDASSRSIALVRYNSDGSLDVTFGTNGIVTTAVGSYSEAHTIALQSDGKILLGGSAVGNFALVRYNSNGSLDLTFDSDGIVTNSVGNVSHTAYGISLQSDGKILLAGSANSGPGPQYTSNIALTRYNVNGSLDMTFDTDGKVITSIGANALAEAIALQPNGKILVAGAANGDLALVRYNSDGSLEPTFGVNGKVLTSIDTSVGASAMTLQPDGKILVVGTVTYGPGANGNFALIRYNNTATININSIEGDYLNLRIYPNPFHSTTTIEFGTDLHDAELSIYNVFGQKVKTISNISDSMIQLNREELATGFYVVRLVQDKKVVATGKIVVTD